MLMPMSVRDRSEEPRTRDHRRPSAAVTVRDLSLSYGRHGPPVIDGANMTVPQGLIYGLLGASGCGKTSLLRCLVGLTKPNAGKILVFGQPLHTMHVPGRGVGYMPQELALYADFTIAENLYFYGKLLGLIEERIFYRITFLCSFFQIMPANRTVKTLSGGQQRRVSLAIALLHEPPFLILDEPTVGLDPVLRDVIWRYFVTLSNDMNSTLVVTTHFIEEIEQAALVGIMKNGKVWCEQLPSTLVRTYGPGSLSSVYLKVCKRLEVEGPGGDGPLPPAAPSLEVTLASPPAQLSALESGRRWTRIRALMAKNMIKIMRRLVTIIFQLVVPSCVGVVFCLFVGGEPYDLPLAIVNLEVKSALGKMYGTEFIDELSAVKLRKMNYDNLADAFLAVRTQEAWATIYIRENFSTAIYQRYAEKFDVPDDIVQESTIDVYMDSTDYTIRGTIEREIHRAHNAVLRSVVSNSTGQNVSVQTLKITDPFYDGLSFTFREFMSPGIIVSTLFAMSISLTALLLVAEKEEGLRDRCTVAGVTSVEVIIGHALVQMALAYMQTVFMLIVFVNVFDAPIRGSLLMCFVIPVTMAFCGMNFGFLTSSISKDEATALLLSLAALYPALLMGGVLWPIEGTPALLRTVSWAVPQALPVHSMRGVMLRNYTATNPYVLRGLVTNGCWTAAFLVLAVIIFSFST